MQELIWFWSVGILIVLIAWKFNYFTMPRRKSVNLRMPLSRVLFVFAFYLLAQIIFFPVLIVLVIMAFKGSFSISFTDTEQFIIGIVNGILGGLMTIGLVAYFSSHNKLDLLWSTNWKSASRDIGLGVLSWIVAFPIIMAFGNTISKIVIAYSGSPSIEQVAVRQLKMLLAYPSLFWFGSILVFIIAPIVEEILFRGLLQTWLRKKMSRFNAIGVASLIFALFHFSLSQKLSNIELMAVLFALSCFLGYLYERQQSLLAPITLHATYNGLSLLFIYFEYL